MAPIFVMSSDILEEFVHSCLVKKILLCAFNFFILDDGACQKIHV